MFIFIESIRPIPSFIFFVFSCTAENSEGRIVYDDRAIEALLDRSQEGIVEKESGMDDYLSSFKVYFICFLNIIISNIIIY